MAKRGANSSYRLTTKQEKIVVKAYRAGKTTYDKLAKRFKVTRTVIHRVLVRRGATKRHIRTIERESVKKAREIAIEFRAGHIAEETAKLVKTGEILSKTMLGEINQEVKRLGAGGGSASDYRALVSAYRDLVLTLRLQRGQPTMVADDREAAAGPVVESIEETVIRLQQERDVEDPYGLEVPEFPSGNVSTFELAKRKVTRKRGG